MAPQFCFILLISENLHITESTLTSSQDKGANEWASEVDLSSELILYPYFTLGAEDEHVVLVIYLKEKEKPGLLMSVFKSQADVTSLQNKLIKLYGNIFVCRSEKQLIAFLLLLLSQIKNVLKPYTRCWHFFEENKCSYS